MHLADGAAGEAEDRQRRVFGFHLLNARQEGAFEAGHFRHVAPEIADQVHVMPAAGVEDTSGAAHGPVEIKSPGI